MFILLEMLYWIVLLIINLIAPLLGGQRTIEEVDFKGTYHGTMADTCEEGEFRFQSLTSISIHDCVIECAAREHCNVLNYRLLFQLCELYQRAGNSANITGNCFKVAKEDIRTNKSPCENAPCPNGSSCDRDSNTCRIEECLEIPRLANGKVLGNLRGVSNKIKYVCDEGYQLSDDSNEIAVCLENGTWSSEGECVETETIVTTAEPCYTQTSQCTHSSVHCVWYKEDIYYCHCNFGYELDTALNTCVKVCEEYSTDYTDFVALSSKFIAWYDMEDVYTVTSLNECVSLCNIHYPLYLSVDMKYKSKTGKYTCYCNTVSEQQYTSVHKFYTGNVWTFYNRPCKTTV